MNGLLILAVVGFAAVILLFASGQVATGVESVMCQFISGPRPDGWPRGVQEEDPRPWNFGPTAVGVGSPAEGARSRVGPKRGVAAIPA